MGTRRKLSLQYGRRSRGGIEGKLLTVIMVLMALSIGMIAWFSDPPDSTPAATIDAGGQEPAGVMGGSSGVE